MTLQCGCTEHPATRPLTPTRLTRAPPQGENFLSGTQQREQRQESIKQELKAHGIEVLRRRQVQAAHARSAPAVALAPPS